jgi:MEDS: MEthanogen/methylotroph, DcmR Sensory domain
MVDDAPDPVRFRAAVTGLLDRAADGGRPVRVYGEMVALLWGAGNVASTIALEDLWNELAEVRAFSLFCGYPIQGFDVQSRAVFKHICGQHSTVVPAESYSLAGTADEQQRVVAELQQENAALRAELDQLRARRDDGPTAPGAS